MAEKDPDKGAEPGEAPSLELPSLGLGSLRRKKQAPTGPVSEPEPPPVEPVETPAPPVDSTTDPEPVSEPEPPPVEPVETPAPLVVATTDTSAAEPKRPFRLPGFASAVLTGALVGLLLVGSVKLALRGCDALRGTDSCGGPGFFLLVVILILLMVLATRILRLLGRTDAGTVALLGVGMAAVVALGLLSDHLLSPWMLLVIPAVSVMTFLVGHWVSTTVSAEA
jgi:hypothetical protein